MRKTKQYISQALCICLIIIAGTLFACSTDSSSSDDSSSDDNSNNDSGSSDNSGDHSGGDTSGTTYTINVDGANGATDYTVSSGTDRNGSVSGNDPSITINVGDTINFVVSTTGHPFAIQDTSGSDITGPTNQRTTSGTVTWTPTSAGTWKYQCTAHGSMTGTITVQ